MPGDRSTVPDAPTPAPAPAADVAGDPALDLGYTVTVDSFSGPLDLLLYLVRRTELDILEVPLALIVDQFVDTVRGWQNADLDVAGDFILMAATLLELKARTIAPPLDEPVEGEADEPAFDPRESLLRSLLAYRRFKEAAQGLDRLEELRRPLLERQVREHIPEAPPEEGDFDLGELDLSVLMTTCERLMARIGGLGPRTVMVDEMPLGVRIAAMLDELATRQRTTIRELLAGNHSRVVHITTVMATLELTRQRFVEVEQPEQFGDIALRLRTPEEREREAELPPLEPDGPRRRRRLPLVTWHAADTAAAPVVGDDETPEPAAPEEPAESDEQRFLRELEEATRVTAVLAVTADVEASFTAHWHALHPELVPPPVAPVVAEVVAAPTPSARKLFTRKTPVVEAAPAAEIPAVVEAAPVTEVPTTVEAAPVAEAPAIVEAAPVAEAPAIVEAAPVAEVPAIVEAAPVAEVPAIVEPAPVAEVPAIVEAAPVAEVPAIVEAAPVVEVPAIVEAAPVAEVPAIVEAAPVAEVPPAQPESPTERILPIEEWPVMHALPQPEAVAHALDDLTSDDPEEVNARLRGEARAVDEDEDEATPYQDPDDLLGDDPALVNAALQADVRMPPAPRQREVIIPPASETTVWTAPVDLGQTAGDAEEVLAPVAAEAPGAELSEPVDVHEVLAEVVREPLAATPVAEPELCGEALPEPAAIVAGEEKPEVPTATHAEPTAPSVIDVIAAAAPRTLVAEPEPAVAEVPAPVAASVIDVIAAAAPRTLVAEPEPAVAEVPAPVAASVIDVIAVAAPRTLVAEPEPEPEPAVAEVPAPVAASVIDVIAMAAPRTLVAEPEPEPEPEPAAEPPPPADGPPPPGSPPPPPRADSPNPAITTTPNAPSPMSPPPRSKLWLLIALIAAINLGWAGWTWFAWVPKDVVEVVAGAELAGQPETPTLLWRFNLDAVDERGLALPPTVVPRISPAIAGRWSWRDRRTLVLEASGPLPLATTFTAALPTEEFRTATGFRLRSAHSDTWSTAALSLTAVAVETFGRDGTILALTFNQPVDPAQIAQELSVELPASETVTEIPPAPAAAAATTPVVADATPIVPPEAAPAATAPVADATPVVPAEATPVATAPVVPAETTPVVPAEATAPVADATPVVPAANAPVAEAQPAPATTATAVAAAEPAPATSEPSPVTTPVVTVVPAAPAAAPAPLVSAISTAPASTVRILIRTPVRGSARARLPAGTRGAEGTLGLAKAWEQDVPLLQTLVLTQASAVVASHGDIRVDVALSDAQAPRDLLVPVVSVDPAVPVTVSTSAEGVSLVGAFVPGQSYRISTAATWPDEPASSGHVLSAYTAASSVTVAIPARPPGVWPLDEAPVDGRLRVAAQGVDEATVALLPETGDAVHASGKLAWTSPAGDVPALLALDELTDGLPRAHYRVRVTSAEPAASWEQPLVIDHVLVRPQALLAATWILARAVLGGNQLGDVPVRVVRLER